MFNERSSSSTARISVTVAEFVQFQRGFSRAEVALIDTGNSQVSQARPNDPIIVYGEVFLDFQVVGASHDQYSYMPIGIGFQAKPGAMENAVANDAACANNPDPLGRAAFPMRAVASKREGAQLTVFDANLEPNDFKFGLIIQRSDGELGIIDPPIRNRGTNM